MVVLLGKLAFRKTYNLLLSPKIENFYYRFNIFMQSGLKRSKASSNEKVS